MTWIRTSPSLALIKYWGKQHRRLNRPATPSLAVGVEELHSYCRAEMIKDNTAEDQVILNGSPVTVERFSPFFEYLKKDSGNAGISFHAESRNDFPTAAGFASSSSGFAALALACEKALNIEPDRERCSRWAGRGSASASRALWGGFTELKAGSLQAHPIHGPDYWPELRLILVETSGSEKPTSSREAMEQCRRSAPGYSRWLKDSRINFREARSALDRQDLEELGSWMQRSYMGMFSLMFSLPRPILYWLPESLELIRLCAGLRKKGIPAWETMDAGPQVKILTTEKDLPAILRQLKERDRPFKLRVSHIGGKPEECRSIPEGNVL